MSWMKRGQGQPPEQPAPPYAAAPQGMYQQPTYSNQYQGVGNGQQHMNYNQQQYQPQFNQQPHQYPPQPQDYTNNANQYQYQQQQLQYQQHYSNQTPNTLQQGYQPTQANYYQNQPTHPQANHNYPQAKPADGWEENWGDWGWEESSKQAKMAAAAQVPQPTAQTLQQQAFNNANVIEESFNSTDTWNWGPDDKKDKDQHLPVEKGNFDKSVPEEHPVTDSDTTDHSPSIDTVPRSAEEVKTLNDREAVKERLPNLALGKRFHLENLTPQWSIESQMSQESSDGPHTHSESTYRSENQSRNSSKSSPGLNTENSNFNYSQSGIDDYHQNSEWSRNSMTEPTLMDSFQSSSRRESHDELSHSLHEMSIANCENPSDLDALQELESSNEVDGASNVVSHPPPSASPGTFPPPIPGPTGGSQPGLVMPPPPPASSANPPVSHLPPPSLPPASFPSSSTNPFKHSGAFSHKTMSKLPASNAPVPQPFVPQISTSSQHITPHPQVSSTNLVSPAAVNKVTQSRVPVGFGANLETTPDNSERPDQPAVAAYRPAPVAQQIPDNLEIAPQNDRNEYLQTAHLSNSDYVENTDFSRNVPPPGLRRMVVGQQESEYNQNLNISGDEPPPGLARMVPGQQNEADNTYNQASDNYMERHIDGQQRDTSPRPFRQPDGQQTPGNYAPPASTARRPIGLDRMVPGEPSNDEYSQYQPSNFVNEERVVTGLDHGYPAAVDAGPSDVREQNLEGSDYTEQRNASRSIRDVGGDIAQDYPAPPEDQQREVIVEGENLQDLSIISSADLTMSREELADGANNDNSEPISRNNEHSDSKEQGSGSRRQSLPRVTSGEDSERDRAFKSSPRRDREKHKSSRERENRYSREERKYPREGGERRSVREERRSERRREHSPERPRRSTRSHRYETEDTDYNSDRERERRRYRESSYASKPPRPDEERYHRDDRDRRRHGSRRYDDERDGTSRRHKSDRDGTYDRHYRDIDPSRKYGNLRRDEDDRRRVVTFSDSAKSNESECSRKEGGSRAESRDAATDEDGQDSRHRAERRRRRDRDPYYDGYGAGPMGGVAGGAGAGYGLTRAQYEYYSQLRVADPAAYSALYRQLMQQHRLPHYPEVGGYGGAGSGAGLGAGSAHSGRSSAAGLKGTDTDLLTDASLNLQLDESTARSDRMTPYKFPTAHTKGNISGSALVLVSGEWGGAWGGAGGVSLRGLRGALQTDALYRDLPSYPGPLSKGVSHKKSVVEYCESRAGSSRDVPATRDAAGVRDVVGRALIWQLLALLLRQNGVVVGSDIAELLMKNKREYDYDTYHNAHQPGSGFGSMSSEPPPSPPLPAPTPPPEQQVSQPVETSSEEALDRYRDLMLVGNRNEALEVAMSGGLWAHALVGSWLGGRRARAAVTARYLQQLPAHDPLRTLYHALHHNHAVVEERCGDWRPHAAVLLANPSARPEHDTRTLTALGDSLSSRGLVYSAQFCYMSAGVPFSRHPLAPLAPPPGAAPPPSPPRLSLLLADPRAMSLEHFATNEAIFATEIYEYAMSLNQDYVVKELQVYKFVLACRLVEAGLWERALGYVESAAACVARQPADYSRPLLRQLAFLADRLQYHDDGAEEGGGEGGGPREDSAEGSPRRAPWIDQLRHYSTLTQTAQWPQQSPAHDVLQSAPAQPPYDWEQQAQVQVPAPAAGYHQPPAYSGEPEQPPQYYAAAAPAGPAPPADPPAQYQQWAPNDVNQTYTDVNQTYADPYWQEQQYSYVDQSGGHAAGGGAGGAEEESRPMITMPGTAPAHNQHYGDYDDEPQDGPENDQTNDSKGKKPPPKGKEEVKEGGKAGAGWLGGILTKLSLRAPNQMILPDDKNPTIVWDEEHKRWKNLDSDDTEVNDPPPPPPKMADLAANMVTSSPLQSPAAGAPPPGGPPSSNIFKMQKGRHIKKSYVDVFNPRGAAPSRAAPPPAALLPPAPAPPPANYFVPALPTQNDVYDTRRMETDDTRHAGI